MRVHRREYSDWAWKSPLSGLPIDASDACPKALLSLSSE